MVKGYVKYACQFSVSIKKILKEALHCLAMYCSTARRKSEFMLASYWQKMWKTELNHLHLGYVAAFHKFVKLELRRFENLDLRHAFENEHENLKYWYIGILLDYCLYNLQEMLWDIKYSSSKVVQGQGKGFGFFCFLK